MSIDIETASRDALVAALRAVEVLHKRMPADRLGGPHCHTDGLDWPCPSVAAITAALDAP